MPKRRSGAEQQPQQHWWRKKLDDLLTRLGISKSESPQKPAEQKGRDNRPEQDKKPDQYKICDWVDQFDKDYGKDSVEWWHLADKIQEEFHLPENIKLQVKKYDSGKIVLYVFDSGKDLDNPRETKTWYLAEFVLKNTTGPASLNNPMTEYLSGKYYREIPLPAISRLTNEEFQEHPGWKAETERLFDLIQKSISGENSLWGLETNLRISFKLPENVKLALKKGEISGTIDLNVYHYRKDPDTGQLTSPDLVCSHRLSNYKYSVREMAINLSRFSAT